MKKIIEIGAELDKLFQDCTYNTANLHISVDKNTFKKIDEDLFYRLKKDGDFIPSVKEIKVNFNKFTMIIEKGND